MRIDNVGRTSSAAAVPRQTASEPTQRTDASENLVSTMQEPANIQPDNPAAAEDEKSVINDAMMDKALEQANKSLNQFDRVIERSVHEKTKTVMYVIRDTKTHEVIGEFPPKKIQDMIAKMWELAGLFVDEKA